MTNDHKNAERQGYYYKRLLDKIERGVTKGAVLEFTKDNLHIFKAAHEAYENSVALYEKEREAEEALYRDEVSFEELGKIRDEARAAYRVRMQLGQKAIDAYKERSRILKEQKSSK